MSDCTGDDCAECAKVPRCATEHYLSGGSVTGARVLMDQVLAGKRDPETGSWLWPGARIAPE